MFNKNARLMKTVCKQKKTLVPYAAKCKYHSVNKGPKQNRRIHSRLRMICVVHQLGMSNFPSHLRIIDLISYLPGRFCVVLFQCIFGKKNKNSLMQFFRNEKHTPFTQILFYTQQYCRSNYQYIQYVTSILNLIIACLTIAAC